MFIMYKAKFCTSEQQSCETWFANGLQCDCEAKHTTAVSERNFKKRKKLVRKTRHCKHSEAIQNKNNKLPWVKALTMTSKCAFTHLVNALRKNLSFASLSHSYGFTLSCKTFRSNPLLALLRSRIASRSQTKFRNCVAHSYGFTLTEVIIVLVILGALALILVPNMMNMVPDDHNIKYKKAFYTIQEIMNDIINDGSVCSGLDNDNELIDDNVYLKSCSGNLRNQISDRLSTVTASDYSNDIKTTNNMRWYIPSGDFSSLFASSGTPQTIIVSLDDKSPTTDNAAATPSENDGIFAIVVSANGKVTPGTGANEQNLLLNSPTD